MLWADPCCHGNDIWHRRGDIVAYRLVDVIYCDTSCNMQAPQPVEAWGDDAVRDAFKFGPSCPQMIFESDNSLEPRDEDCLHLNIYSPYRVSHSGHNYFHINATQ